MKKLFTAHIEWIPYESGGRMRAPSEGIRYCPLIRIDTQNSIEEWSIDFICPDFNKSRIIKFKFLVEDAPEELLNINTVYGLYEGSRKVAKIKIINILN